MKVGDYARTKNYGIAKILNTYNNTTTNYSSITLDKIDSFGRLGVSVGNNDIIKSSPNIIDLIEEGDYVNGCIVTNRRASVNEHLGGHPKQIFILKQEGNYNDAHFEWLKKEDIKSIVTKEQFESMEYKVKE